MTFQCDQSAIQITHLRTSATGYYFNAVELRRELIVSMMMMRRAKRSQAQLVEGDQIGSSLFSNYSL